MFHLAPTGLQLASKSEVLRSQQSHIEDAITAAIRDYMAADNMQEQKMIYNISHPNTMALIKSLDRFFAHGLIKLDKCYWSFVREFIPTDERINLKTRWNCSTRRHLSLAWLKDSLNRENLQFQMFGFIACGEEVKKLHYDKNSCVRNIILLKRVCLLLDDISHVEFLIEPPYIFRTEDTPIALATNTPVDGTFSPVQSSNTSIDISYALNIPLNIHRKRETLIQLSSIEGSLGEMTRNSYLDCFINDLPEVNLSSMTNIEPTVQSEKELTYVLDETLKFQRRGFVDNSTQFNIEDEYEQKEYDETKLNADITKEPSDESVESLIPEDPCSSGWASQKIKKSEEQQALKSNTLLDTPFSPILSSASLNSSELLANQSSSQDNDELSALDENEVLLEGEVYLDSGEIIQLQLELCIKDGERIHRMFQIFTGHAAGQPLFRYLLLTDQFIYLLASSGNENEAVSNTKVNDIDNEKSGNECGLSSINPVIEELAVEAFERNLLRINNEPPKKFTILIAIPYYDVDHLTIGVDAQVLCFHSKHKKFHLHTHSGHEQRTFLIETCSRILGKTITFELQRIIAKRAASMVTSDKDDLYEQHETVRQLSITTSHSSQLGMTLKRFLRRELGIEKPEIMHLSLVYWQQNDTHNKQQLSNTQLSNSSSLDCFLYVRELYQWSWTRKAMSNWQQSYFVLRGLMLYQFTDSTFKFAQRSLNLRKSIEQVYQLDLKNDEKYTFQLTFAENATNDSKDGLVALQFSCPNADVMNRWINALSLALSISCEVQSPVPCMAILTETHIVFAQEGINCIVDGFMRSLSTFHIHECAEIFALCTDFHAILVIRRDNGLEEWLIFRENSELQRLIACLRERWQLPVLECNSMATLDEKNDFLSSENKTFNSLFIESAQIPDLWHNLLETN